ncbi:hypothetical protein VOLCADRAFT_103000 [Volvox carteri f. nagariensis]|uniref:Uncharacterized protein n=1 Tax=Volvox carteri f. nagariensis TaxID=3068 RepID=D8TJ94_VOLCA|nr:uncharacterized protein VOLCADRAFT_103000 [Volvox carteri f. nagariensis]EFJ52335.1 hypothetical protein VOLCADRAFT_103000 [Volvox carteri f. nagariensis]|eukprot:XP_002946408.1 hypothetical protein VOLCADRAFT_103000 [Volvox carteri f. nagariensis]
MAPAWSLAMTQDETCSGPNVGGLAAEYRTVASSRSSSRSTPYEEDLAPVSRRASYGAMDPVSPVNPCWALDTASMICPYWKVLVASTQYVQMNDGYFGGYSWPRVVPPPNVFNIWNRAASAC